MPGYTARATPDLKACIDLIVRPGRHPLAPDITEARLERVAGAASGRLGRTRSPARTRSAELCAGRNSRCRTRCW
ncbi:hypothetical protein NKH18_47885 [Streptomyces sp. M10(2022)]